MWTYCPQRTREQNKEKKIFGKTGERRRGNALVHERAVQSKHKKTANYFPVGEKCASPETGVQGDQTRRTLNNGKKLAIRRRKKI